MKIHKKYNYYFMKSKYWNLHIIDNIIVFAFCTSFKSKDYIILKSLKEEPRLIGLILCSHVRFECQSIGKHMLPFGFTFNGWHVI